MRSTQVSGKYDTRAAGRIRFTYIALDIGRTEQMPGALQPDAAYESFSIYDGVPLFEGYGVINFSRNSGYRSTWVGSAVTLSL